jgi:ABC-2 type transport system permease protein
MSAATAPTVPTGPAALGIPLGTRLAGFGDLFRLAWRRDRILVPSSVIGLVVLAVGSAQATLALYPTDASAATGLAGVLSNPSVIALYGPISSPSADALAVFKTVMMGAFLTAVLGFVVVRRHTRTEEDEGRLELLGAGVVGRWAPLSAAVALATIAVVAAGVLSGAGLAALGMDVTGSVAFAVSWLTAGLAMVGITAVVVQLASTTRGAAGLGFGSLGAMYAVRAIADSADPGTVVHGLGWLSPLGWAGRVEPYGANRTWLLLLGVLTLAVGFAGGLVVLDRRDLGAGIIPARNGRRRARRLLAGPFALVTRLARGTILGWTVGMVLGGVVVGSLLGSVAEMVSDPGIQELLENLGGSTGTVEDVYVATEIHFVSAAVAAAGIALVLRLVGAERSGLGEVLLSTPTSRARWFGAHVVLPVVLTTALMALLGAVVGLVGPSVTSGAPSFGASVAATLAALPAVWVMIGVAAALAGALPRFAPFSWGVLLVTFMVTEIGPLTTLPEWVIDLSPFTHLSPLPGGSFETVSALGLSVVALALVLFGLAAYERRDVT